MRKTSLYSRNSIYAIICLVSDASRSVREEFFPEQFQTFCCLAKVFPGGNLLLSYFDGLLNNLQDENTVDYIHTFH